MDHQFIAMLFDVKKAFACVHCLLHVDHYVRYNCKRMIAIKFCVKFFCFVSRQVAIDGRTYINASCKITAPWNKAHVRSISINR